jgi:hypothetical protein
MHVYGNSKIADAIASMGPYIPLEAFLFDL